MRNRVKSQTSNCDLKKYAFFYHYNKQAKAMTVHFRGRCIRCTDIVCKVPCRTKWNKRQPLVVMKGQASSVILEDQTVTIN